MSFLSSSLKPRFEFPRALHLDPLSPGSERGPAVQPAPISRSNPAMFGVELDPQPSVQTETPTAGFKRVSTLAYHSGLRQHQDRPIHKSSKSLIVVIPPENFSQEHGQLGHTLSSGPRNRLSQGILMPLLPTMYGQLTAIARQFNFPSTLGLCLYLQISDGGISATPRISDDSWQFLWGHLLDGSDPITRPHGLPIGGRIEFDIDMSKARWYTSWIAASRRDVMERVPLTRTPSMSHSQGDSRTLCVDEQISDEQQRSPLVIQQTPKPSRHIPKKLSLLSRPTSRSRTVSPEFVEAQITSTLSPIMQHDEPQTAKQDLEKRVNSWRVNTSIAPTSLPQPINVSPETGISTKIVSVDNPRVAPAKHRSPALNLDDFTCSTSSARPPSEGLISPLSHDHLLSVHLDRKIEPVCLTPSVCISFRPFDYDLHSPMADESCLPSPDIAHRMLDNCPPTPTTATSWGAPLSYPPSPFSDYRAPSIHLDCRGEFSRPVTPATATSWGAPMSWPATPLPEFRAPSVDLGERSGWSRPATPSTATSPLPPISYPQIPSTPFHVHVLDAEQHAFDSREPLIDRDIFASPYCNTCTGSPWTHVWPYRRDQYRIGNVPVVPREIDELECVPPASNYPHLKIYPAVYPHFDLYPAVAASEVESIQYEPLSTMLPTAYPVLDIYPACYPYFNLYHNVPLVVDVAAVKPAVSESLSVTRLQTHYPDFDLYPDISPSHAVEEEVLRPSIRLTAQYPYFDLYPSVYPFVTPYPLQCSSNDDVKLASPPLDFDADEPEAAPVQKPLPVTIEIVYPKFNIYPAVYPAFDIYPCALDSPSMMDGTLAPSRDYSSGYPVLNISVYPYLEPYPAWWANFERENKADRRAETATSLTRRVIQRKMMAGCETIAL